MIFMCVGHVIARPRFTPSTVGRVHGVGSGRHSTRGRSPVTHGPLMDTGPPVKNVEMDHPWS